MLFLHYFPYGTFIPAAAFAPPGNVSPPHGLATLNEALSATGYVLVENGDIRSITAEEYQRIIMPEALSEDVLYNNIHETLPIAPSQISPQSYVPSFRWQFYPESSTAKFLLTEYRVSPIYESASTSEIVLTYSHTETRTVTQTAGIALSSSAEDAIYTGVSLSYSYASSAASSMSDEITQTMVPSTQYKYSAVVFRPKVYEITGRLCYYQAYQGTVTLLSEGTVIAQYPCSTSGGMLDGVYRLMGSNSLNSFP